jgi:hypothetical protein
MHHLGELHRGLEIEVARRHRDHQAVGGHHRIDRREVQRRSAVEQDEVVLRQRPERLVEAPPERVVLDARTRRLDRQQHLGVVHVDRGRHDVDRRPVRAMHDLAGIGDLARQHRTDRLLPVDPAHRLAVAIDLEGGGQRALRIEVHEQHAVAARGQVVAREVGAGGLRTAALEVHEAQDVGLRARLARLRAGIGADRVDLFEAVLPASARATIRRGRKAFLGLLSTEPGDRAADFTSGLLDAVAPELLQAHRRGVQFAERADETVPERGNDLERLLCVQLRCLVGGQHRTLAFCGLAHALVASCLQVPQKLPRAF